MKKRKKYINPKPFLERIRRQYERWPAPDEVFRELALDQLKHIDGWVIGIMQVRYRSPSPDVTRTANVMEVLLKKRRAALEARIAQLDQQAAPIEAPKAETAIERVPWRLLGDAAQSFPALRSYLDRRPDAPTGHNPAYDMGRLEFLHTLAPTNIYQGIDDFNDYLVFYFQQHQAAVLECAQIGNAIYVLYGDWRTLSRKSKAVLLSDQSGDVRRIRHIGDWKQQVRNAIAQRSDTVPGAASPRTDEAAPATPRTDDDAAGG